jgi:hypothetical protein
MKYKLLSDPEKEKHCEVTKKKLSAVYDVILRVFEICFYLFWIGKRVNWRLWSNLFESIDIVVSQVQVAEVAQGEANPQRA